MEREDVPLGLPGTLNAVASMESRRWSGKTCGGARAERRSECFNGVPPDGAGRQSKTSRQTTQLRGFNGVPPDGAGRLTQRRRPTVKVPGFNGVPPDGAGRPAAPPPTATPAKASMESRPMEREDLVVRCVHHPSGQASMESRPMEREDQTRLGTGCTGRHQLQWSPARWSGKTNRRKARRRALPGASMESRPMEREDFWSVVGGSWGSVPGFNGVPPDGAGRPGEGAAAPRPIRRFNGVPPDGAGRQTTMAKLIRIGSGLQWSPARWSGKTPFPSQAAGRDR